MNLFKIIKKVLNIFYIIIRVLLLLIIVLVVMMTVFSCRDYEDVSEIEPSANHISSSQGTEEMLSEMPDEEEILSVTELINNTEQYNQKVVYLKGKVVKVSPIIEPSEGEPTPSQLPPHQIITVSDGNEVIEVLIFKDMGNVVYKNEVESIEEGYWIFVEGRFHERDIEGCSRIYIEGPSHRIIVSNQDNF